MRRLALALMTFAALAFAAVALAARPPAGVKYRGFTSAPAVNGFKDPISFLTGIGGRSLKSFTWGTFGCFGAGGFPPGKNPYTLKGTTARMPAIPVSRTGSFSRTANITVGGSPTVAKVSGRFSGTGLRKAAGKIVISQTFMGRKCGPATVTFTTRRR